MICPRAQCTGTLMAPLGFPGTRPTVAQRLLEAFVCLWKHLYGWLPWPVEGPWYWGILLYFWNKLYNDLFHISVLMEKAVTKHFLPTPHRAHQALQILTNKSQQPSGGSVWHREWHGCMLQKLQKGGTAESLLSHFSIRLWGSIISSPLSFKRCGFWAGLPRPSCTCRAGS